MRIALPSRKIFILIALIAAALIIFAAYKYTPPSPKLPLAVEDAGEMNVLLNEKIDVIDTDNDSLKDWEEVLWKTDPKKPDTDNDGTPDGEEIKLGRDPLKAGSDDKLAVDDFPINNPSENESDEDLNNTQRIARGLFSDYLNFKQAVGPMNEDAKNTLINGATNAIENIEFNRKKYSSSDISKSDDSVESIKTYGNATRSILFSTILNTKSPEQADIVILEQAVASGNIKDLEPLQKRLNDYQSALNKLEKISVPPSAVNQHIELLESVSFLTATMEGMTLIFTDSFKGTVSIKLYADASSEFYAAVVKLNNYFESNGITFST